MTEMWLVAFTLDVHGERESVRQADEGVCKGMDVKEIWKVNGSGRLKCFQGDIADFVINALSHFELVKRFEDVCNRKKFRSRNNCLSERVRRSG